MDATPKWHSSKMFTKNSGRQDLRGQLQGQKKTLSPHLLMMSGPGCHQVWQQNAWRRWTCRTPRTCPCRSGDPSPAQEHAANTNSHQTHTHEHPHQAFDRHPKKKRKTGIGSTPTLPDCSCSWRALMPPFSFSIASCATPRAAWKFNWESLHPHPPSHFYTFTFWYWKIATCTLLLFGTEK